MDGRDDSDIYLITNSSERTAAEINDTGSSGSDELRFAATTANQTLIIYASELGLETVVIGTGTAPAANTSATTALNVNAAAAPNGLTIRGNDGANRIISSAYADSLDGGGGSDIYLVSSAAHKPAGETISDSGASGVDELRFASTTNGETITLQASDTGLESVSLGTGTAVAPILTAATTLHINAAAAANGLSLQGNYGFNSITGGAYDDRLNGNRGNDTLTTGGGADIVRFDSTLNATTNRDTITDFNPTDDRIELENAVFTALSTTGTLSAAAFSIGTAASTANHRILYNTLTGTLTYDSNGNASGGATVFAQVTAGLAMHAGLFLVT
jgi:Ca2+-binding RTX toxin-like protein